LASAITDGLPIGLTTRTRGRTLGEGECAMLTNLTWTIGRFHTERAFAETTTFGGVILGGAVLVAVATGLINTSDFYRDLDRVYGLGVVAVLGMKVRYHKGFRAGDTLWVETTVTGARESKSQAGRGVIEFKDRVCNHRDELLVDMERQWLFERHAAAAGN
jgi:acyl dehydratase